MVVDISADQHPTTWHRVMISKASVSPSVVVLNSPIFTGQDTHLKMKRVHNCSGMNGMIEFDKIHCTWVPEYNTDFEVLSEISVITED